MAASHSHSHHSHKHSHGHAPLKFALLVTLGFCLVELLAGFYSNSLALMTDAAHMFTDVVGLGISALAMRIASRPKDRSKSFGYHRAEILGALGSGLLVWALAGALIFEAFSRVFSPPEVKSGVLTVVALLGLGLNFWIAKNLHPHREENLNMRAAYLHVMADLLGSIGATVAGLLVYFKGWNLADPLITLVVAGLVLYSSWKLVFEAVNVLMESVPAHLDLTEIESALKTLQGVKEVHELHVWAITPNKPTLTVHISTADAQANLLSEILGVLKSRFKIEHATVQLESPTEKCPSTASPCKL